MQCNNNNNKIMFARMHISTDVNFTSNNRLLRLTIIFNRFNGCLFERKKPTSNIDVKWCTTTLVSNNK